MTDGGTKIARPLERPERRLGRRKEEFWAGKENKYRDSSLALRMTFRLESLAIPSVWLISPHAYRGNR